MPFVRIRFQNCADSLSITKTPALYVNDFRPSFFVAFPVDCDVLHPFFRQKIDIIFFALVANMLAALTCLISSPSRRHDYNSFGEAEIYCCRISCATLRLSERTVALTRLKSSGVITAPHGQGLLQVEQNHPSSNESCEERVFGAPSLAQ
jgi:hypothetical protein